MKHVPDAHGNCSRWCDHMSAVPTHNRDGKPLTHDGHVIRAGLSPFHEGQWDVYIEPNHTDMAHEWEPSCGWHDGTEWRAQNPCPLRVDHTSSHAGGHYAVRVVVTSTYSFPTCYSEER
jgi:hypothetical protein